MGKYSVPEEIRAMKPRGTCVKNIKGHYYVYEQKNIQDEYGNWHRKSGACIGKIEYGLGFVSNEVKYYDDRITTLEYGQYAITLANTQQVLDRLLRFFEKEDAYRIYILSVVHFVNTFQHRKSVNDYVEQSFLSILYPSLKFGDESVSRLVDTLGRRQERVQGFEQSLVDQSSGKMAVDGHVIKCCSYQNDTAAYGNKYRQIKDMQMNILMAYDVESSLPLFSRIYEGGTLDKSSIKDLLGTLCFQNILFIVDRGFYSTENIKLFSADGNKYIIPLSENLKVYKDVTTDMNLDETFIYEKNKKKTAIQYTEKQTDGKRVLVFRDSIQNAVEADSYRKSIGTRKDCTAEKYEKLKDFFGLIVLQTNLDSAAPEIFSGYKKRWNIETFYNYFKNDVNFNALYERDYYKLEGMSFIMLITSLIYEQMNKAVHSIKNKNVEDCIIESRMVKIHYGKQGWVRTNMKKSLQELFSKLNVDYTLPITQLQN